MGHKFFPVRAQDRGSECLQPPWNRGGSMIVLNGGMVDATEGKDRGALPGEIHCSPNNYRGLQEGAQETPR